MENPDFGRSRVFFVSFTFLVGVGVSQLSRSCLSLSLPVWLGVAQVSLPVSPCLSLFRWVSRRCRAGVSPCLSLSGPVFVVKIAIKKHIVANILQKLKELCG